ncbi:MAG: EAL domain-containing protein [Rhizobium sp.]|nr:EAL domain-containing protein [Rhizobium sp.]
MAVAFLDLDNFKLINDTLGHDAGDELLKEVAGIIIDEIGLDGLAARIGGDEFVVVLRDAGDDLMARAQRLRQSIGRLHLVNGHELRATASIGLAVYPDHGASPSHLLARADLAMYRTKRDGRDGVTLFAFDMADEASQKLLRQEELRRALNLGEFILHYQPQKNLRTGAIIGVEALVRWNHPSEGLIAPGSFIPMAEENGLILELGATVLEAACRQGRAWQDAGLPPMKIGVNMSARQFQDVGLTAMVADVLARTGLDPRWLEIEITESIIMKDVDAAVTPNGRVDEAWSCAGTRRLQDGLFEFEHAEALSAVEDSRLIAPSLPDLPTILTTAQSAIRDHLACKYTGIKCLGREGVGTQAQADFLLFGGMRRGSRLSVGPTGTARRGRTAPLPQPELTGLGRFTIVDLTGFD